jgi:hypothetical protein
MEAISMLRTVTPEEMGALAQLAAENPDLRLVVTELAQLRALRGSLTAPAPLRPSSFRELLKGVDVGVLSASEARPFLGLPPRRSTLERLLTWSVWPLHVGVPADA